MIWVLLAFRLRKGKIVTAATDQFDPIDHYEGHGQKFIFAIKPDDQMELISIKQHLSENEQFALGPDLRDGLLMTIDFYKRVGFNKPWIGYYAQMDGQLVGAAGFKGKPVNQKVEIAYGVFPQHLQKGVGTAICGKLVQIALTADPNITITARTLPDENYSARILRKNQFELAGTVMDDEDGEVWEWIYKGQGA